LTSISSEENKTKNPKNTAERNRIMDLGEQIKQVADTMTADGTVEQIIREQLTEHVKKIIDDSFRWGELYDVLKNKITEIMVPAIKECDFGKYLLNMDDILTDVVNETAGEANNAILRHFKELMTSTKKYDDVIKMSTIIGKYEQFVADEVDTDDLDVVFDDGPSYESVDVKGCLEIEDDKYWNAFDYATMDLTIGSPCEEQGKTLNRSIRLHRFKKGFPDEDDAEKKFWRIDSVSNLTEEPTIRSLGHLTDFDVFLISLLRAGVKIELDEDEFEDEIIPSEEPEPTYE
jgi:hypothetical protein